MIRSAQAPGPSSTIVVYRLRMILLVVYNASGSLVTPIFFLIEDKKFRDLILVSPESLSSLRLGCMCYYFLIVLVKHVRFISVQNGSGGLNLVPSRHRAVSLRHRDTLQRLRAVPSTSVIKKLHYLSMVHGATDMYIYCYTCQL